MSAYEGYKPLNSSPLSQNQNVLNCSNANNIKKPTRIQCISCTERK